MRQAIADVSGCFICYDLVGDEITGVYTRVGVSDEILHGLGLPTDQEFPMVSIGTQDQDFGPTTAPYPIGSTAQVIGNGTKYDGLTGTVQIIQPDDPENSEFEGEEAAYSIEIEGHEIMQAFSYWQLRPSDS